MLHFVSKTDSGAVIQYDLHSIRLKDGRLAHKLDGAELYRELKKLKVPGIDVHQGHQTLLQKYAEHLAASLPE